MLQGMSQPLTGNKCYVHVTKSGLFSTFLFLCMKMATWAEVCARNSPVGIEALVPVTAMLLKELSASEFLPSNDISPQNATGKSNFP